MRFYGLLSCCLDCVKKKIIISFVFMGLFLLAHRQHLSESEWCYRLNDRSVTVWLRQAWMSNIYGDFSSDELVFVTDVQYVSGCIHMQMSLFHFCGTSKNHSHKMLHKNTFKQYKIYLNSFYYKCILFICLRQYDKIWSNINRLFLFIQLMCGKYRYDKIENNQNIL